MDLNQLRLVIGGDATGATNALNSVGVATNKMGSIVKDIIAGAAVAAMVSGQKPPSTLALKRKRLEPCWTPR